MKLFILEHTIQDQLFNLATKTHKIRPLLGFGRTERIHALIVAIQSVGWFYLLD